MPSERIPLEVRFWSKVDVPPSQHACWEWRGVKTPSGYGRFKVLGSFKATHRVAYELLIGAIPDGLEIDHLCRNRACVNPAHMEPVTHAENLRRAAAYLRRDGRTHCRNGHEFGVLNTYRTPSGWKRCRTCLNDRHHQRQEEMHAHT